ncbi:hypothetical protein [Archangium sp.]
MIGAGVHRGLFREAPRTARAAVAAGGEYARLFTSRATEEAA